jgi:hypothetical protein
LNGLERAKEENVTTGTQPYQRDRLFPATATRDVARLVGLDAVARTGELSNARYFLKLG